MWGGLKRRRERREVLELKKWVSPDIIKNWKGGKKRFGKEKAEGYGRKKKDLARKKQRGAKI